MLKYLSIVFLFFTTYIFTQNISSLGNDEHEIRKLKDEISNSKNDSIKSFKHLKLSGFYFKNGDLKNYQYHVQKARGISNKSNFLRAYSDYYSSLIHLYNNDYEKFNAELILILEKLKKINNSISIELKLIIIQNISTYYINLLKHDESIKILIDEGIPLAKKSENYIMLGSFNHIIGNSFYSIDQNNKAKKYFEKGIYNFKKEGEKGLDMLNSCSIDYAMCLINLKEFKKSKKVLNEVSNTLKKFEKNNLYPKFYYAYGFLFDENKRYHEAINYYKKGIDQFALNKTLNKTDKIHSLLRVSIAKSMYHINDFRNSLSELDSLYFLDSDISLLKNKYKYQNFEKLGDYKKAFHYLNNYNLLKDSINTISKEREYRVLESKYNASEKEKKIVQLEKEKNEKEIRLKNLRLWYGFVSTILIIALILFYFLYKNYKNQISLNSQKDIIHKQNFEFLNSQKEIEIMQAMINGEEAERKRIARDLHDGIGSRLSSLKMQLENLDLKNCGVFEFEKFNSDLSLTIRDLRQTAFNLVPETLTKLGLELALKDLCFTMSNMNVAIQYSSNEISSNILSSHQITIFRIVQELLNNALKHSNCSEIVVDCSQNNDLFLITVEDNGVGFNTNDFDCYSGLGLKNIKSRVELLKGKLEVVSNSCHGTIFNIELTVHFENERKI